MTASRRLSAEVRAIAVAEGADLIGIAPAAALVGVEEGKRPDEYLPGATTVVAIGVHIPHGVCDLWGQPGEPGRSAGPYLLYGYGITAWEVSRISMLVARHLELAGHRSICFQPAWSSSAYRDYPRREQGIIEQDFAHQQAAAAAGLGELGLSGLCLTPEFGARQRFGSVLTDAPLVADLAYAGAPLCRPAECGELCARVCPTQALDPSNPAPVRVGHRSFPVARLDGIRCLHGLGGLVAGTGSRATATLPPGPGIWSDYTSARQQRHPVDALLVSHSEGALVGHFCERCLHQCPAHTFGRSASAGATGSPGG